MALIDGLVEAMEGSAGLCGAHDPAAAVVSLPEIETRLRVLALGAIMDVFPIAARWEQIAALAANGHWLVDPSVVAYKHSNEVVAAFQEQEIPGPKSNAKTWLQVCKGVQGRFKGSFRDLLAENDDEAERLQAYLGKSKTTFPVLAGEVISARWLDLVHRWGGVEIKGWKGLDVELSEKESEAARELGYRQEIAHPQTALALSVWDRGCDHLTPPACDFAQCPRRTTPSP